MKKIHITRLAAVAGVTGALAIASVAFAADKKPTAQPAAKAPFANVTVVTSPEAVAAFNAGQTTSMAGMRAFVDPVTREFRGPNAADFAAEAAAARSAKTNTAPAGLAKRSAVAPAAAPAATLTVKSNGAKQAVVDEALLSYSVAHVAADGTVKLECVEGKANAEAKAQSSKAVTGVDRHEK